MDGYFERFNYKLCASCHQSCKTCYDYNQSSCTSCPLNKNREDRSKIDGSCPCKIGFFD